MPRTKEFGEKLREATRDKIINAAVALFAENGLAGTSVSQIAKQAGISVGLMYHYYKTKEEIFAQLVEFAKKEVLEFAEALNNEQSPKKTILDIADEMVKEWQSGLEFSQWIILSNNLTDDELSYHGTEFVSSLENLIKKGQKQGDFKAGDYKKMALFFLAMLEGVASLQLSMKGEFTPPTVEMITAFLM